MLHRFQQLQRDGVLDLLTCAATHGYLPLLRHSPEAVRAQLINAVREHQRLLGVRPLGIWLPECAYYEGLDLLLRQCGLRYAVLDAHGLLHALPRPRYGVYAPICSPAGIAFFARDGAATLPVWSASEGFPGDGHYREFHRDLGWDLPEEELRAHGIPSARPLGLKLHRVSGRNCPSIRNSRTTRRPPPGGPWSTPRPTWPAGARNWRTWPGPWTVPLCWWPPSMPSCSATGGTRGPASSPNCSARGPQRA